MIDASSARSNHHDASERNQNEEKIPRQSPQQKRAASPVALADEIVHKKVKLDPTIKKKQAPPVAVKTDNTTKTIVNKKKPKLVPCKSSSVLDEKIVKPSSTNNNNNSTIESKFILENIRIVFRIFKWFRFIIDKNTSNNKII